MKKNNTYIKKMGYMNTIHIITNKNKMNKRKSKNKSLHIGHP